MSQLDSQSPSLEAPVGTAPSTPTLSPEPSPLTWQKILNHTPLVLLLITLLWAAAYLPALAERDLRLEEGRRATPALEMLRSGNYLVPTLYGETYLNKPPLYFYAIIAISPLTGGINELATRLPSALSALAGAYLLLAFAPRTLPKPTRALAALAFLACPILLDKATLGELDAFVSTLTLASVLLWYNALEKSQSAQPSKPSLALHHWLLPALFMALAVLGKGPVCLAIFYLLILPSLLLTKPRNPRPLLSLGHLLFLLISLTPILIWVYLLHKNGYITLSGATSHWAGQMGGNELAAPKPKNFTRYLTFLPELFLNIFPWSIYALLMFLPKISRALGYAPQPSTPSPLTPKQNLHRFLALGSLVLIAAFYLYPAANTRHVMMVAFPLVTLAAIFLHDNGTLPQFQKSAPLVRKLTQALALLPALAATGMLIFAFAKVPAAIPQALLAAALCLIATILLFLLNHRTSNPQISIAFAVTLAAAILLARGSFANVFLPFKATTDTARILHTQLDQLLPKANPVFTTRCFSNPRGDAYYNIQFYIPGGATAVTNFQKLPRGGPITLICLPSEIPALQAALPNAKITNLGTLQDPRPKTLAPLALLQIERP